MNKREEKIIDVCIDVFAHSKLDYEIDFVGNGCNASECWGMAMEILTIIGLEYNDVVDIAAERVKKLKSLYE